MNYLTEKRLARTEQRAQEIGMISKPAQETFTFIDDPEGVEKCRRDECSEQTYSALPKRSRERSSRHRLRRCECRRCAHGPHPWSRSPAPQ
jgi:hypothetical protein